jgi:hypothetical protein
MKEAKRNIEQTDSPPPAFFMPADQRLAAALCLVALTFLLVSLAARLRLLSRSR